MAWLRYSDDFSKDRSWDGVSYEARWHYLAVVEECSQARRWDGGLARTRALRCSDVGDPARCLTELIGSGRLRRVGDSVYVVDIDDHVPPEGERDENLLPRKRANVAAYRQRKCENGQHSRHCPKTTCPEKAKRVTDGVTGNPPISQRLPTITQPDRSGKAAAPLPADTSRVTGWVTGNPGTGRFTDGESNHDVPKGEPDERWPAVAEPGFGARANAANAVSKPDDTAWSLLAPGYDD